ncbi:serine hydrolase domain-containing protein [Streptomyces flaveolus]|uniref:serine hydrolase domain-containing protein n=1 Tax=Streptomyces flaveolus TaxID=67297 RepID=UPI0037F1201F
MSRRTTPRIEAALQAALSAGEVGIQVAAYLGDELVVDTWAGETSAGRGGEVTGDTLFPIFSVTKALTATAAHLQVERGLLRYDQPVCEVWPDYAQHGKDSVTLEHVLAHRSGAPTIPAGTTVDQLLDWEWMCAAIAAEPPVAPPDTMNAYSPYGFGFVVGELVRRTDTHKRSFHEFVRAEILGPLGLHDFHLGLPDSQRGRVANLTGQEPAPLDPAGLGVRASPPQLPFGPSLYNRPEVQAEGLPSAGGVATAKATAKLFTLYAGRGRVDGERFLSDAAIEQCRRPRPLDPDQTYGYVMPVGYGGLWHIAPGVSDSNPGGALTEGVLSHTGAGGTVAWAEPDRGLAVAILHNRGFFGPQPVAPFGGIGDAIHDLVG